MRRTSETCGASSPAIRRAKSLSCSTTPGDPDGKVLKLLEFAGTNRSVDDPWYTGDFETTWRDVNDGCRALLRELS